MQSAMHRSSPRGQEKVQAPGVGLHLRTKGSSEGMNMMMGNGHRSPRVEDRRSPRSPRPERKLSTRVADLETKLGCAQGELKKLKQRLASADVAKHDALSELGETKKSVLAEDLDLPLPISNPSCREVAEVIPLPSVEDVRVPELRSELAEKTKELESAVADNGGLRKRAEEWEADEKKLCAELRRAEKELEESKAEVGVLKLEVAEAEKAKGALESDMRRLRVQSEQWRKAAETAAAVLANGGDVYGFGSLMATDEDDGFGGGKGKSGAGAGARMFSDLWKKKG